MLDKLHSYLLRSYQFFLQHRKAFLGITCFIVVVVVGSFIVIQPARADVLPSWEGFKDVIIRTLSTIALALARFCLKLTQFMVDFLLVIAGYNGYLDSTAVNVGWVMVRDLTNMGFVVILLIIAFATILGFERYEWKKLLPKFIFAAILVNFSRTICGLLIDASQIIMVTFLNGISATIAGNVIEAFKLTKIESFNKEITPDSILAPGILVASLAALGFSILVLSVMGIYVLILLGRLIRLWILIVLSPLAFVLSVLPKTQPFASQWWGELGDNLVTGPVILFFVWLSFVTVGTGQVYSHVAENSVINNTALNDGGANAFNTSFPGGSGAEQYAGVTDILGWNNMANFAIAIGLLFAGAQVASRIGGSSGNLMSTALNAGKKVAMVATGVAAGQWLYGKGSSGARGLATGAYNMVLGNRLKQYGTDIKGRVGQQFQRFQGWRNEQAKTLEQMAANPDQKDFLSRTGANANLLLASIFSTHDRKMRKAEQQTKAADLLKEINQENLGVGGSEGGQNLLELQERLNQVKAQGEVGKKLKQRNMMKELNDRLKPVDEAYGAIKDAQNLSDSDPTKAQKIQQAQQRFANLRGQLNTEDQQYFDQGKKTLETTALVEKMEAESNRNWEVMKAVEKDRQLVANGDSPIHEQAVRARHLEEDNKMYASASLDRMKEYVNKQRKRMDAMPDKNSQEYNREVVRMAGLQRMIAAHGTDGSLAGEEAALEGMDQKRVEAGDVVGQQARELSKLLRQPIEANKEAVKEALDALKEKFGETNFNVFMESYVKTLEKTAQDGALNKAGLFRGELNPDTNQMVYHAVDMALEKDRKHHEERREYALSKSTPSKTTGFDASIDRNERGEVTIESPEAMRVVSDIFGSLTAQGAANTNKQNISTFNRALPNMTPEKIKELVAVMLSRSKKNGEGVESLLKRTNIEQRLGAKIDDFINNVVKPELPDIMKNYNAKLKAAEDERNTPPATVSPTPPPNSRPSRTQN